MIHQYKPNIEHTINMLVDWPDPNFRCSFTKKKLIIFYILITTDLSNLVLSNSLVTDSISSTSEFTTISSVTAVAKQFCGNLEIRDQVESPIIVNVTEGQNISPELFSVIYDKIKGAAIVLKNENCMIQICGFRHKSYFKSIEHISTNLFRIVPNECKAYWKSMTSLSDNFYGKNFTITHISCGCKKHRTNCKQQTCKFFDKKKSTWPEEVCGMLFQEKNCQECYHDGILLKKGEVFETRNSVSVQSTYFPKSKSKCHGSGNGLPYSYDMDYETLERQAVFNPKTPKYAWTDQSFYYCYNCRQDKTKRKIQNITSKPSMSTTLYNNNSVTTSSTTLIIVKETSTEVNIPIPPNTTTMRTISDSKNIGTSTWYILGSLSAFLFFATCFGLWFGFRRKLFKNMRPKVLTKEYIMKFKKGDGIDSVCKINKNSTCTGSEIAWKLPYDQEYEIDRSHLEFGAEIGGGVYGTINEGTLLTKNGLRKVAIKTPREVPEYCKDVLNEIKILTYLGNHPNLVKFIGACTINLKEGKVHYVMELCQHGSLFSYLETQKKLINPPTTQCVIPSEKLTGYCVTALFEPERFNEKNQELFNLMVKWSEDIASGMEFIHEKKILHIDLATRNILLGENLSAKLADFGLSRKLYEKLCYEKTGQAHMPFRWMAIESLTSNMYTEKSDVWAYGVTVWEIYEIGSHPYPNMGFKEICVFLLNGTRLECPIYATQEIYDKILLCWNADPSSRPCFKDLKEFYKRIQNNFHSEVIDS